MAILDYDSFILCGFICSVFVNCPICGNVYVLIWLDDKGSAPYLLWNLLGVLEPDIPTQTPGRKGGMKTC